MQQTLAGQTIVVTRPQGQAQGLCERIEALGGQALLFPVLGIAPAADDSELAAVLPRLDSFDLAYFVSPNAVEHAFDYILPRRGWPIGLRVTTVGPGSARALHERGFEQVIAPAEGFDSEAVLALPEFSPQAVRGRRVLVFRGDGGRPLLGDVLRERGAEVEFVTTYRRFLPTVDASALIAMAEQIAAVVLTSSEGVRNFAQLLGPDGLAALRTTPVYVPHPRIAGFARDAGFGRVFETAPGDAGIVAGLLAGQASGLPPVADNAKSF